ncbi:hypothetical protein LIER_40579 [Lithospermum erythrorhizon]|uniref:CCHC-type domain-containing protein n=1 Tax=Lithospermum erythrorhizon TaxID=34254 RepID=A0AAV3QZ92_LITER
MCFHCGRLGHLIKQCAELEPGVDCRTKVVYGLWIKAPMERSWVEFKMLEGAAFPESLLGGEHDEDALNLELGEKEPVAEETTLNLEVREEELVAEETTLKENNQDSDSDTRQEAFNPFNFRSNSGVKNKRKGLAQKIQSKKRHHPYHPMQMSSSPSKKPTISNVDLVESSSDKRSVEAIEVVIDEGLCHEWRFVAFYGNHEVSKRKLSWELLRHVDSLSQMPTVYMGDFNEVLLSSEHVPQRRKRPAWQMNQFSQTVKDESVQPSSVGLARLDRALASKEWEGLFPEAKLQHISTYHSDHLPLLLCLATRSQGYAKPKSRFRFEASWCLYESSKAVVQEARNSNVGEITQLVHI